MQTTTDGQESVMSYCQPQGAENDIMETVLYCQLQTEVEKDIMDMAEIFRVPMVIFILMLNVADSRAYILLLIYSNCRTCQDNQEQLSESWKECRQFQGS